MKYGKIKNYSNGEYFEGERGYTNVESPLSGEIIAEVSMSSMKDLNKIVEVAKKAQKEWGNKTFKQRSQVLYNYRQLLEENKDHLAEMIQQENGKTYQEALADVNKAVELTEFACSIPQIVAGEIEEVSGDIICRNEKRPLGVVGCISPFNFPIMVPHWTVPNVIALGNAVVLKPSELTPISILFTAKLWEKAGLPNGIFNILNGGKEAVEAICDHPDIKAVSFVGSTPIAQVVYKRATSNLKRALCLGGARNHIIVTPDADIESATRDIIASATGMSGQRCMAASVLIIVGENENLIKLLQEKIEQLEEGTVISKSSVQKLDTYIQTALEKGASILVDGRNKMNRDNKGNYFGSTMIDWGSQEIPKEEVFGPVLEIVHVKSLEEALLINNNSMYGNSSSIFTKYGKVSESFIKNTDTGMIGVNIGVPVPREPFSFGGTKNSKFGVGDITGKSSLEFWTNTIKITTKWKVDHLKDWMS